LAAADGGFDLAIEAAGATQALAAALAACRRGATIVQVGTLPAAVCLPLGDVMARELTLASSFRFGACFADAFALIAEGRVAAGRIVSAVLPLADLPRAMDLAAKKRDVVKVQVEP